LWIVRFDTWPVPPAQQVISRAGKFASLMPRGNVVAERRLGAVVTAGTDVSTRKVPAFREARPTPTRAKAFVLGRFFRKISRHRACSVRPTALALLARPLGHREPGLL